MLRYRSLLVCLSIAIGFGLSLASQDATGQSQIQRDYYYPAFNFKPMWEIYGINPYAPNPCRRIAPACLPCEQAQSVMMDADTMAILDVVAAEGEPPTTAPSEAADVTDVEPSIEIESPAPVTEPATQTEVDPDQSSLSDVPMQDDEKVSAPGDPVVERLRREAESLQKKNDAMAKDMEEWRNKARASEQRARAAERMAKNQAAKSREQKDVLKAELDELQKNAQSQLKRMQDEKTMLETALQEQLAAAEKQMKVAQENAMKAEAQREEAKRLAAELKEKMLAEQGKASNKKQANADKKKTQPEPKKRKQAGQETDAKSLIKRLESNRDRQIKKNTERITIRFQDQIGALDKSAKDYESKKKKLEDQRQNQIESMTKKISDRINKKIEALQRDLNSKSAL